MRRSVILSALFSTALVSTQAVAAMKAEPLEWTVEGETFSGWLVHDDASDDPRPGLVMVPNWMGVTDDALARARMIAGDDYVVLVADVYGKGRQPKDSSEAGKLAGSLRGDDRGPLRARMQVVIERTAHATPLRARMHRDAVEVEERVIARAEP
ncbi:MAG TPA: dienelactone hydrolase family protein, partial [Luteimonas sp.]|nr:dienelactone hydrolase family protein [Luteimonas sp.]